ncbi:hypothetical protein ACOSP7_007850 [Xanthoceras sorbifolium]
MSEYLMKKKSVMDALAFTGHRLSNDDKLMYILGGLGPEYDPFVISVTSVLGCCSLPELTITLLAYEARLERHNQPENLSVNMPVNKKGTSSGNQSGYGGYGRGSNQNFSNNHNANNQNQNGGRTGNQNQGRRGRERNKYNNNGRPQCQICYRVSHTIDRCYYRFDQSFQLQNSGQNNGNKTVGPGQMSAMIATPDYVADPLWYTDNRATNHYTPEG